MGFKVASRVRGLSDEAFGEAFGTKEQCRAALVRLRWPGGFVCPWCGVNGGGIMLHARRPGGPVAAAQNCATHGPLSVATRGRRCTAWSSMRRFDWRLSTRV